jgi:NAD(P)-dependent dehydrogenase (short-subunit alcohol dehydrogenase family)
VRLDLQRALKQERAMKALFAVDDEVVVVTGVSGLLGWHYANGLLALGAAVVGLDVRSSPGTAKLEAEHPLRFRFLTCDVTSHQDLQSALERTKRSFGPPTVLVNNAAIDSPPSAPLEENGPFEGYPDASWNQVMNVNVTGVYLACKVFGGDMAAHKTGSIINVSSIYGVVSPDQSLYEYRRKRGETFYKPVAYAASKAAVLNLTRYLAVYWARAGVRVNTLVIAGVENSQEPEFLDAYCARIPIGRMASPADYMGAVAFLASGASKYMTGSQLVVDGGWTAI